MAIALACDNLYILNHGEFVRRAYQNTCHRNTNGSSIMNLLFKQEFFSLDSPYLQRRGASSKKSKKRKIPRGEEEIREGKYHDVVAPKIQKILDDLPAHLSTTSLSVASSSHHSNGNCDIACGKCSDIFRDLCFHTSHDVNNDTIEISHSASLHFSWEHIAGRHTVYKGGSPRTVCISGQIYLLPKNCAFLMSDASKLDRLVQIAMDKGGFDIIVMDPPWENKSAKRSKQYAWLSLGEIAKIPLAKLASRNCIIFIWVTNNQKMHRFVKEELFPANGIQFLTEWHWLKITAKGAAVFELSSIHKRPYETIIIGKVGEEPYTEIPDKVLASIPCSHHSHKPPLDDVISRLYSSSNPKCLELFARNLKPGWSSWGNEVLQFQDVTFYESDVIGQRS